ncbi:hypothetical protein BKD30_10850 [Tersicoccus phoenicis]|uniref:O-antigen ligase-related domain-containing protein n=1 Tax=Tersicoccus phoenicis TaxID=554083 RepID=A0A1R1L8J6_9MICC|nr:hypothetical protein BKD30_10850 [Tersicoccus phoenicis]
MRIALFIFIMCVLASFVKAALTALPQENANGSMTGLITVASWAGVVLVANDGIRSKERLLVLVRRICWLGAAYSALGLLQFVTGQNLVDAVATPGLSSVGQGAVDTRGGFIRPEATARHALEFASVLSMTFALALFLAQKSSRSVAQRWTPAALTFAAAVVSLTRSALLGIVSVLVVLFPSWDRRMRRAVAVAALIGITGALALAPSLASTVRAMFNPEDPSLVSRTSSYDIVGSYVAASPWWGRGLGTLDRSYHIFDNQYIGLLIQIGVIGLAAFLGVVLTAAATGMAQRRDADPDLAALGPALSAAVVSGALLFAFFDAFYFPQSVGLLFLVVGLCGALRNLHRADRPGRMQGMHVAEPSVRRWSAVLARRWYVALAVCLAAIPIAAAARSVPGVYYTEFDVRFEAPPRATRSNPLRTEAPMIVGFAAIVQRMYVGSHPNYPIRPTSAPLFGTGARSAQAVYLPDAGGQWQTNFNTPAIRVEVVGDSPDAVLARSRGIASTLTSLAKVPQDAIGVRAGARIETARQAAGDVVVSEQRVRTSYAVAATSALAVGVALGLSGLTDHVVWRRPRGVRRRQQ